MCGLHMFANHVGESNSHLKTMASSKTPSVVKRSLGCVSENLHDFSAVARITMHDMEAKLWPTRFRCMRDPQTVVDYLKVNLATLLGSTTRCS